MFKFAFPTVRVRSESQIGLSILRSFLVLLTIHICMALNIRGKIPRCFYSYFSTECLKPDNKTVVLSQSSNPLSGYKDICWAFGALEIFTNLLLVCIENHHTAFKLLFCIGLHSHTCLKTKLFQDGFSFHKLSQI